LEKKRVKRVWNYRLAAILLVLENLPTSKNLIPYACYVILVGSQVKLAQNQYTPTDQLNGENITEVLLRNSETQSDQMFSEIYKYLLNDYKKSFT